MQSSNTTTAPPVEPALLTSQHVADLLSVSVRTLWRMVERGQFPAPARFNRKLVRFSHSSVHRWLAEHGGCQSERYPYLSPTRPAIQSADEPATVSPPRPLPPQL